MTFDEISRLAYTGEPLKNYASLPEQYCYWTMRALYFNFQNGRISAEKAAEQKNQIHTVFERAKSRYEDEKDWREWLDGVRVVLGGMIKEVESGECERCKMIFKLLDGRIQPEDCVKRTVSPYGFGEAEL